MAVTDVCLLIGAMIDRTELFPDLDFNDIHTGWRIMGIDNHGQPYNIESEDERNLYRDMDMLHNPIWPSNPRSIEKEINDIFLIDQSPYKGALGNDVILGVYLTKEEDGFLDATFLIEKSDLIKQRIDDVSRILISRGLPNAVKIWVVATPHL